MLFMDKKIKMHTLNFQHFCMSSRESIFEIFCALLIFEVEFIENILQFYFVNLSLRTCKCIKTMPYIPDSFYNSRVILIVWINH